MSRYKELIYILLKKYTKKINKYRYRCLFFLFFCSKPKSKKQMNTKQILIMVAVAAVVTIAMDYVLPYKVDEETNELKRI